MTIILITLGFSAVLAFVLGLALGFFEKKFKVETDPKIGALRECLPGVNCGGCGYPGCDGYADAMAKGLADVNHCAPGGKDVAQKLAAVMGVTADTEEKVALLTCQGCSSFAPVKGNYVGIKSCRAAKLSAGSTKVCPYGCIGYGDCEKVCQFDALHIGEDGLPKIDSTKCTGCGVCTKECPQMLLTLVPKARKGSITLCANRSVVKANVLKACKVGCMKCESCVKVCPEHCISMVKGIPVVDYSKCTNCGSCVEKCPTKAIKLLQNITSEKA